MSLREVHPCKLANRHQYRLAMLAIIARVDVHFGGAKALVIANRAKRLTGNTEYQDVVSQAYTNSHGNAKDYLAYECPECGCAHMGQDAAWQCCQLSEVDA